MDRFIKHILRFWKSRREAADRKRRISNLVNNSNCFGTTSILFRSNGTRAAARDLIEHKKARR